MKSLLLRGLLLFPLAAAAPLACAGVALPGLAYPDAAGVWKGAELGYCTQLATRLKRLPAHFTPVLQATDAPGGNDVLFVPRGVLPPGFHERSQLADDYEAILVPAASAARSVEDLAGHPVCVEPGSPDEAAVTAYFASRHLRLEEFVFQEVDEMHDAYLAGRCDGIVSSVSLLTGLRGNAEGDHQADRILPQHLGANPIVVATKNGLED